VRNLRTVDLDKIHKAAKPIWKKHFRFMMSYDAYFEQIMRYNIYPYLIQKNRVDKKLFLNYKNKVVQMTLQALTSSKPLGIGTEFGSDDQFGN
jgi:hypothetical protein